MVDKNQMKRNIFRTDAILKKVEWVIIKAHYFVVNVQIESTLEACATKTCFLVIVISKEGLEVPYQKEGLLHK